MFAILTGYSIVFSCTSIDSSDISYLLGSDAEEVQRSSALFLLKLKEEHRISQVAIDNIVEDSRGLFFQVMERVQAGVTKG